MEIEGSKLTSLYTAPLHSIKRFEHKIRIKLDKYPLAGEQNNYLTKILSAYFAYDLNAYPRDPNNSFNFENWLLGY